MSQSTDKQPIRVALEGLSASAKTSWAAIAHLPYLQAAASKGHYQIVALLNSSKEAAERAVEAFELDAATKAYGSAEEVAVDRDIDLVVALTRVDVHWPNVKPSIAAGKWIFIEAPMASSLEETTEIVEAVRRSSLPIDRTFVGLQSRLDTAFALIKKLVTVDAKLGKIHSVNFRGTFASFSPVMSASVDYFNDFKVGGNMGSIYLINHLDPILYSLGDADLSSLASHLLTGHKHVTLLDSTLYGHNHQERVVDPRRERDTHDQIMLQGCLTSTSDLIDGALISVHIRGDKAFKGDAAGGASLRTYGERGEIHLSSSSGALSVGMRGDEISLQRFDTYTDAVETYRIGEEGIDKAESDSVDLASLPVVAQDVGRLYEMFRKRQTGYATVQDGLQRHELLERIYQGNSGGR